MSEKQYVIELGKKEYIEDILISLLLSPLSDDVEWSLQDRWELFVGNYLLMENLFPKFGKEKTTDVIFGFVLQDDLLTNAFTKKIMEPKGMIKTEKLDSQGIPFYHRFKVTLTQDSWEEKRGKKLKLWGIKRLFFYHKDIV